MEFREGTTACYFLYIFCNQWITKNLRYAIGDSDLLPLEFNGFLSACTGFTTRGVTRTSACLMSPFRTVWTRRGEWVEDDKIEGHSAFDKINDFRDSIIYVITSHVSFLKRTCPRPSFNFKTFMILCTGSIFPDLGLPIVFVCCFLFPLKYNQLA